MTAIASRTRQPAGLATGGQFATEPKTEPAVSLTAARLDALTSRERDILDEAVREVAKDVARHTDDVEDAEEVVAIAEQAILDGDQWAYLRVHGHTDRDLHDLLG